MADPLLAIEDLAVEYVNRDGTVRVVDRVGLTIGEGELVGLAGESGSGKSTIVQAVLRILPPPAVISGGRVMYRGNDVLDMSEAEVQRFRWREVSLVMQSAMNALNPVLSIGDQIIDVIEAHERVSRSQARDRAATLLDMVGIDARLDSYPHELSGGMRQRVVIAMALALKPALVMMDEPTTALDVVTQKEILEQITVLQQEEGFAVLLITHDLSLMFELCDHIGVLYAGRLVESAPAGQLLDDARHPYTQALMESFPDARRRQDELTGIGGSPPNMSDPPSGCRFHPRCNDATAVCGEQAPQLIRIAHRRLSACHLHQERS